VSSAMRSMIASRADDGGPGARARRAETAAVDRDHGRGHSQRWPSGDGGPSCGSPTRSGPPARVVEPEGLVVEPGAAAGGGRASRRSSPARAGRGQAGVDRSSRGPPSRTTGAA
jgi:hypothetical protein